MEGRQNQQVLHAGGNAVCKGAQVGVVEQQAGRRVRRVAGGRQETAAVKARGGGRCFMQHAAVVETLKAPKVPKSRESQTKVQNLSCAL